MTIIADESMRSVLPGQTANDFIDSVKIARDEYVQHLHNEIGRWEQAVAVLVARLGGDVEIADLHIEYGTASLRLALMHDKDNRVFRLRAVNQAGEIVSWKGETE